VRAQEMVLDVPPAILHHTSVGKQSKQRKRALGRAKIALRSIIGVTSVHFNDTRMIGICSTAKRGLLKR
jgi:hypothetical protein